MAPMKRKSTSVPRAGTKSRKTGSIATVVNAIAHAETLPEDLRTTLKATLPIALGAYKSDRHAFEKEVVDQGAAALKAAQTALKSAHQEASKKQSAVISLDEMKRREAAKAAAEGHLTTVKGQVEECKAARSAAEKAVDAANDVVKAAHKDGKVAQKDLERVCSKKAHLTDALGHIDFLKANTSGAAAGKKALRQVTAIGKEFSLDGTLLQTLSLTCKKSVNWRTAFENMVFQNLQALIEGQITAHAQMIAEAEAVKANKDGVSTAAEGAKDAAKNKLDEAEKALSDKQDERTNAQKEVTKAETHLRHIWIDMRKACDEQDHLAEELQNFETQIWGSFNTLKEHEEPVPEPEPAAEEPVADAAGAAA